MVQHLSIILLEVSPLVPNTRPLEEQLSW